MYKYRGRESIQTTDHPLHQKKKKRKQEKKQKQRGRSLLRDVLVRWAGWSAGVLKDKERKRV